MIQSGETEHWLDICYGEIIVKIFVCDNANVIFKEFLSYGYKHINVFGWKDTISEICFKIFQ